MENVFVKLLVIILKNIRAVSISRPASERTDVRGVPNDLEVSEIISGMSSIQVITYESDQISHMIWIILYESYHMSHADEEENGSHAVEFDLELTSIKSHE